MFICSQSLGDFSEAFCLRACLVTSVLSDSLRAHGLQPTRLLCPWHYPGKNTGVGCHALLQGIFQPRDWTDVSCVIDNFSCLVGRFFTAEPLGFLFKCLFIVLLWQFIPPLIPYSPATLTPLIYFPLKNLFTSKVCIYMYVCVTAYAHTRTYIHSVVYIR